MKSSANDNDAKYIFLATWFDGLSQIVTELLVTYFLRDGAVELYDRKARRIFLKRAVCETVQETDFFVGSAINVFSRKLRLVACLNQETNIRLESNSDRTLVILRCDAKRTLLSLILDSVFAQRLLVVRVIETCLTKNGVALLRTCCLREWQPLNASLDENVLLLEIVGSESVRKTAEILERQTPDVSERNILYQTSSAIRYLSWEECKVLVVRHDKLVTCATDDCTCCLIKPHAIKEGLAGKILVDIVNSGFEITFIQLVDLVMPQSELFLEVYKGVVAEHHEMVKQLVSGPLLAMAIRRPTPTYFDSAACQSAVATFREFVGPADPEIARQIRPATLRAKYGTDRVKNAVHCTDLLEDDQLQVKFFLTPQFQRGQRMH